MRALRKLGKTLHQIWLEVTGALFIGIGVLAIPSAWKELRAFQLGHAPMWRLLLAGLLIALSVSFGIYSFWKARRVR